MCQLLKVSRSGYYKWKNKPLSEKEMEYQKILTEIRKIHKVTNKDNYGYPRVHNELISMGYTCGRNKVARIMRENGIRSKIKVKWKATTDSNHKNPLAPNLLKQKFKFDSPNKAWVSDITYVWTKEGWLYLCMILDLYSRKIIGWSMDSRMKKELVINAIKSAYLKRKPSENIIFHSDRGSQYASRAVVQYLKNNGFRQSMSAKGNCYDNAVAESFFKTLKTECVYCQKFSNRAQAKLTVFKYIEVFYNRERRHSSLGYISPLNFEKYYNPKLA
jgi:putative transposase